jgi:hypothetical protein
MKRTVEQSGICLVRGDQREHLIAYIGLAADLSVEEGSAIFGGMQERSLKQLLQARDASGCQLHISVASAVRAA